MSCHLASLALLLVLSSFFCLEWVFPLNHQQEHRVGFGRAKYEKKVTRHNFAVVLGLLVLLGPAPGTRRGVTRASRATGLAWAPELCLKIAPAVAARCQTAAAAAALGSGAGRGFNQQKTPGHGSCGFWSCQASAGLSIGNLSCSSPSSAPSQPATAALVPEFSSGCLSPPLILLPTFFPPAS